MNSEKSILLDLGVGFYHSELRATVLEESVSIVDANKKDSGIAEFSLADNPAWKELLNNGNRSIIVNGDEYDAKYAKINNLQVKRKDEIVKYDLGMITPRAYEYNVERNFRDSYFGKEEDRKESSIICKLDQINEYQIMQNGFTFVLHFDNFDAWQDGRLRIDVKNVCILDFKGSLPFADEKILSQNYLGMYLKARECADCADDYIGTFVWAIRDAWLDRKDPETVINQSFPLVF